MLANVQDTPGTDQSTPNGTPSPTNNLPRLRERPVLELLDHVDLEHPQRIYDLGCGTGIATQLRQTLAIGRPDRHHSSAEMLEEATYLPIKALWQKCDVREWRAQSPADLLFAAAVLHFTADHQIIAPAVIEPVEHRRVPLAAHMPNWRDALWYELMLETLETEARRNDPLALHVCANSWPNVRCLT